MVSALPSSNWTVTTVSGAARATAGPAIRQPAARAADAPNAAARDRRPRVPIHLVMGCSCPSPNRPGQHWRGPGPRNHPWLGIFPNQGGLSSSDLRRPAAVAHQASPLAFGVTHGAALTRSISGPPSVHNLELGFIWAWQRECRPLCAVPPEGRWSGQRRIRAEGLAGEGW